MNKAYSPNGFTLIEVMIALSILALSLLVLYSMQGGALLSSGRAESMQTATYLARQKMSEKILQMQTDLAKGTFPQENNSEEGLFEPPFEKYRWELTVKKVEIPISGENLGEAPTENAAAEPAPEAGEGETPEPGAESPTTPNQAPENAQRAMAQMISKQISEAVRDVTVKIFWDELGEDQFISVTTHLVKL